LAQHRIQQQRLDGSGPMQEIIIDRLGRQGDGLTAGGLRAPFTLPGERLRGTVTGDLVTDVEILAPSPDRVRPPCALFGSCGGCALQHASDDFLADWKADTIRRALAAHRLETEIRPTLTSPPRSRRRAVLAGARTRKTATLGFHARRSGAIVPLADCHVLHPDILAGLPALAAITRAGTSRSGAIRLAVTAGPAGLDVAVAGAKPLDAALGTSLADIAAATGLARLGWDGEPVATARPPFQTFGTARVVPPPGAFLQATAEGEAALVAAARTAIGPARRIADLFCGCGTFTLPLADTAEVLALEGDAAMVAALEAGWRGAPGLHRVVARSRDLFSRPLLAAELKGLDAVVIDPPRAGAEAQSREIAGSGLARVASISCDPASFARDAAILVSGGFRLDWVQPVDQFRWSGHVELAAQFSR
jgi:23S rRNA (uracil1939-C5)-methyltransferase